MTSTLSFMIERLNKPSAKPRLRFGKLWWWMVAAIVSAIGWQMWELHLYNAAVREAEEAGFTWTCEDTFSLIKQDWRNALKKETWGAHPRVLDMTMGEVPDLAHYREMLHHLHPTVLDARGCQDENVDALKGLTALQEIHLYDCPSLQNVDALQGLTALQELKLWNCTALQNVDALKGLTALQKLDLSGSTALQNVDGLKGLTALKALFLGGCNKIPAAALRELCADLPNTGILFQDGTENPPQ